MSKWRRCDSCRKVKQSEEFDADAATCRACLTAPAPRRRAAPSRPDPAPVRRVPATGGVGSGDLEARERRARRIAAEQLAELHPQDYAGLLAAARRAEGLRAVDGASTAAEPS